MASKKFSAGVIIFCLILGGFAVYAGWFYSQKSSETPNVNSPSSNTQTQTSETKETTEVNTTDKDLKLPEGFQISTFAKDLVNPRVIITDPNGVLIVSITSQGKVVALPDKNNDHIADEIITVTEGLNKPHGLAFNCTSTTCILYIGETNQVTAFDYNKESMQASNPKKIIDLPNAGFHFTRTLLFSPPGYENKLLIAVGSSCNVCHEQDERRAKILIANADGSDLKDFARGLRNSVFMTLNKNTGQVWATEMGRDLLGDDLPPDEINIIKENGNYGWPNCYGKNIHDDNFDHNTYIRNPCMEPFETAAQIDLQAHSAPLGLAFVPDKNWPADYAGDLIVAFHGSWNRSVPTGFKLVHINLDKDGNFESIEDFISGWHKEGSSAKSASGRPAGILIEDNGDMFVSDDKDGLIYYINYAPK